MHKKVEEKLSELQKSKTKNTDNNINFVPNNSVITNNGSYDPLEIYLNLNIN
jgi:hypothetical protein